MEISTPLRCPEIRPPTPLNICPNLRVPHFAVQQVYDIPFLFVALHHLRSSVAFFASEYFAENLRSLSICSLFLHRVDLPFILPYKIYRTKTFFVSICMHVSIICVYVANTLLLFCKTDAFVTLSFQLRVNILFQIQSLPPYLEL